MTKLWWHFFVSLSTGPAKTGYVSGVFAEWVVYADGFYFTNFATARDFTLFRRLQAYNAIGHAIGSSSTGREEVNDIRGHVGLRFYCVVSCCL